MLKMKSKRKFKINESRYIALFVVSGSLKKLLSIDYGKSSNKRPGRLLNFEDFRRGVYCRGAFKTGRRL